jgi:outer membrane biosynthesis protein TonB
MSLPTQRKTELIAAAITLAVACLMLLLLSLCGLTWYGNTVEQKKEPVAMMPNDEEEELFIEPEIIKDAGEETAEVKDEPAATPSGLPEKADEPKTEKVVKADNPKKNTSSEKLVTQKQPSPVKTEEPTKTDKEESAIASNMGKQFSAKNGTADGKNNSYGSGGKGEGVAGKLNGRDFLGCPLPKVQLKNKVVVVVKVEVDADGKVVKASISNGGGASQEIQNKCVESAKSAKWSAKPGAAIARGQLTFTIVPKV